MIKKPLLAVKADLLRLQYPIGVTPKLDGIRCLIIDGIPVSRTLKPIRNKAIAEALTGLPSGLDGELIAESNNFQDSTSAVMSANSTIPWKYYIFDYVKDDPTLGYTERIRQLVELNDLNPLPKECILVKPEYIYTLADLKELHHQHIIDGYEGTMVRDPQGPYKFGRSTLKEGTLLKLKEFSDTEAVIIACEELMHNDNEATTNALGRTERSTHKENKRASGMLGAFVVHPIGEPDLIYKVGTGFTHEQREEYWANQEQLLGKLVKVKYFETGVKRLPRFPTFIGFRSEEDL